MFVATSFTKIDYILVSQPVRLDSKFSERWESFLGVKLGFYVKLWALCWRNWHFLC